MHFYTRTLKNSHAVTDDSVELFPYHVSLTQNNFVSLGKENKHLLFSFHSSYQCSIRLVNVFISNSSWNCDALFISELNCSLLSHCRGASESSASVLTEQKFSLLMGYGMGFFDD